MNRHRGVRKTAAMAVGLLFLAAGVFPGSASARDDVALLKQRLEQMASEMAAMQEKAGGAGKEERGQGRGVGGIR